MHDFSIPTAEQILFTHAARAADGAVRCVRRGNVASTRYPADQVHCVMDSGPHARCTGRSVLPRRCLGFSACPNHSEPHHPGSIDNAGGQRDLSSDTQSDVSGLCAFIAGTRHVFGQVIRIVPCAAVHGLPSALPDTTRGKSAAVTIWCFVRGLLPAGTTLAIEGFKPARATPAGIDCAPSAVHCCLASRQTKSGKPQANPLVVSILARPKPLFRPVIQRLQGIKPATDRSAGAHRPHLCT